MLQLAKWWWQPSGPDRSRDVTAWPGYWTSSQPFQCQWYLKIWEQKANSEVLLVWVAFHVAFAHHTYSTGVAEDAVRQGTQGWVLALLLSAALLPGHTAHSSRTQVLSLQNVISRPNPPYIFHLSIFTTTYKAGSSHGYRNWSLGRLNNSDHTESGRARTWTQVCLTWKDSWTRPDIPVSLCPELGKVTLEMDSKVIISGKH